MIVEFLKDNGPTTAREIFLEFPDRYSSFSAVIDDLTELRLSGRVYRSQSDPAKYSFDEDFCCPDCSRSWPSVRRKGHWKYCHECQSVRIKSVSKKTEPVDVAPLKHDENYLHWSHDLSFPWLSKPLIRAEAAA